MLFSVQEVKVNSPDYRDCDVEEALRDFTLRVRHYEDVYQPLDETTEPRYSFMQIYNAGQKVFVHRHEGTRSLSLSAHSVITHIENHWE